jgi:cation transport ATPase
VSEETKEAVGRSKPWQWPGEWVKDEKFWREVTARATSGLLVVFVGYIAAMVLGYISTPTGKQTINLVVLASMLSFCMFCTIWFYRSGWLSSRRRTGTNRFMWVLLLIGIWLAALLAVVTTFNISLGEWDFYF